MRDNTRVLHVISFDVPYPADYGGVIDVFYKLKALRNAGIDIILHCFQYGRERAPVLEEICSEVNYYPRKTGLLSQMSVRPYIVESRKSAALEERLLKDDHPILAEGIHSTAFLSNRLLSDRTVLVRTTNIEHEYYRYLAGGERNIASKIFFSLEACRLKRYEKQLGRVSKIIAISHPDQQYFESGFGKSKVEGVYAFHQYGEVESLPGRGDFILYHGKLDIAENYNAVKLILPVFDTFREMPLVVAGMNPPPFLVRAIERCPNVRLISNPDTETMQDLIRDAHAHLLVTTQPTGLKLKLLAALFRGRFVVVNDTMIQGTGLEPLCSTGNSTEELHRLLSEVAGKDFTDDEIHNRRELLVRDFCNRTNAEKLIRVIDCFGRLIFLQSPPEPNRCHFLK